VQQADLFEKQHDWAKAHEALTEAVKLDAALQAELKPRLERLQRRLPRVVSVTAPKPPLGDVTSSAGRQ
jgi:transcription elongation GreA/GreB family factor